MAGGARREHICAGHGALRGEGIPRGHHPEIAKHLGISEALMFKYFPSKEALYRAIIQKRTDGSEEMFFPRKPCWPDDRRSSAPSPPT